MKKNFTLAIMALLVFTGSLRAFSQCTSGAFNAGAIYDFATSAQGFTGDFTYASAKLNSTTVNAGTTKLLTSPTFFQPVSPATLSWGFDLSGSANVTGYLIEAIYFANGSFQTVTVCSAPTSSIIPGVRNFTANAPAQILGAKFVLKMTFTVSGGGGVNITIDNFRTSASIANAPLPVKFSSLEANTVNNSTVLMWKVATEENMKGYNIEKSTDGSNFSSIGFVNATGSNTYSFPDNNATLGGYYRIQSVDVNGKYGYSTVIFVKNNQSLAIIKAFPVPAFRNLTIQHGSASAETIICISSADGRIINRVVPTPGTQQTQIELSSVKAGIYLVSYTNKKETSTIKIVKQ
jgi:hypothetical protein